MCKKVNFFITTQKKKKKEKGGRTSDYKSGRSSWINIGPHLISNENIIGVARLKYCEQYLQYFLKYCEQYLQYFE